jgi:excisionase family DNA binding protein
MEKRPNHRPPKERSISQNLNEEYYTIYEVADLLKLHHNTVRRMITRGELPAMKCGRIWRIRRADLEQFATPNEKLRAEVNIEKGD